MMTNINLNLRLAIVAFLCSVTHFPQTGALVEAADPVPAQGFRLSYDWCHQWTMESRVNKAQLILVARVSNISAVQIVHGAKVNTAIREYRFQPVSVLKGVFTRDELSMTDADLGLPAPDPVAGAPFEHGEHVLLILSRNRGSYGCVGLPSGQSNQQQLIPRLTGGDDPIVAMTRTMIAVSQAPSSRQRAELSMKHLEEISGPSTVPLILSLGSRGYWVQTTEIARILADLTEHESSAVRGAAAETISSVLASSPPLKTEALKVYSQALKRLLDDKQAETQLRVAAITGLGRLGEYGRANKWIGQVLVTHLQTARSYSERTAAALALGELNDPATAESIIAQLKSMPLDERSERELPLIAAVYKVADESAADVLRSRLDLKLTAGHGAHQEIIHLGKLRDVDSMPVLLKAADDGRFRDEAYLSGAFRELKAARAIPVLKKWLASPSQNVRWSAVQALDAIDTPEAVSALRLRLKSEPDLRVKLMMTEVLGRHGFADGSAIAMEHLADPGITTLAARALAAIGQKQSADELWNIIETSNDRQWSSAALQGLASMKDERIGAKLKEILGNERHPLMLAAIDAAMELDDGSLVELITPHVLSRNHAIAQQSLAALNHLITRALDRKETPPGLDATGTALITVLNDPDIHMNLRLSAFETLRSLDDNRLNRTLRALADRARLENTELLKRIQIALTRT